MCLLIVEDIMKYVSYVGNYFFFLVLIAKIQYLIDVFLE